MSYKAALIDNVFYLRWIEPEESDVNKIIREVLPAAKKDKGIIYVAVSPEDSPPPNQETRSSLVKLAEQLVTHCEEVHMVFEAKGFKASIKRNVMTGILLASRKLSGIKVHKSRDDLFEALSEKAEVASLRTKVEELGLTH